MIRVTKKPLETVKQQLGSKEEKENRIKLGITTRVLSPGQHT